MQEQAPDQKFKSFKIEKKKFEILKIEQGSEPIGDATIITNVEPIEEGGLVPENREDLVHLVESPLVEACQELYDKGIRTVFSSANKKDVTEGFGYIAIDLESLSQRNKEIALENGEVAAVHGARPSKGVYLKIPLNASSTVGEVRQEALRIARLFEQN